MTALESPTPAAQAVGPVRTDQDRPIIFSAPMVLALLDGRKTQTRRLVTPGACTVLGSRVTAKSPAWAGLRLEEAIARKIGPLGTPRSHLDAPWEHPEDAAQGIDSETRYRVDPIVEVGDRLYVRETWRSTPEWDAKPPREIQPGYVLYEANGPWVAHSYGKIRTAIHMPRWASRLTLLVTDVRVDRLNDISEADAVAEGLIKLPASGRYVVNKGEQYGGLARHTARARYADLWNSLHGADAWAANPWVVAVTFTVHRANIDSLPSTAPQAETTEGARHG